MTLQMGTTNTLVQSMVDDEMRGRVMAFYAMAFMGMAPLGSLIAGSTATYWGAPRAVAVSGVALIVGGLVYASRWRTLNALAQPIFARKGLIPEEPSQAQ
jgi:MFS family permease